MEVCRVLAAQLDAGNHQCSVARVGHFHSLGAGSLGLRAGVSQIDSRALSGPTRDGVKVTLIVQLAPELTAAAQVLRAAVMGQPERAGATWLKRRRATGSFLRIRWPWRMPDCTTRIWRYRSYRNQRMRARVKSCISNSIRMFDEIRSDPRLMSLEKKVGLEP